MIKIFIQKNKTTIVVGIIALVIGVIIGMSVSRVGRYQGIVSTDGPLPRILDTRTGVVYALARGNKIASINMTNGQTRSFSVQTD